MQWLHRSAYLHQVLSQRTSPNGGMPTAVTAALEGACEEVLDVLDVDDDAVGNDRRVAARLGDRSGQRRHRHTTDTAVRIKDGAAAHAPQTRVLHDVAVIDAVVDQG